MPTLPRSTRNRSIDPSPLPASSAVAAGDAPSLARFLEILDRLHILLERALPPTPARIFSDYLTPAELATEFGIREDQLSEWKCNGLGPPRTRIRQLVIYRRKGGSPRGAGAADLQHPAEITTSPAPTAGPARHISAARPEPALCTITHPRQRGLIDAITWE
jgi:hypothetical protein